LKSEEASVPCQIPVVVKVLELEGDYAGIVIRARMNPTTRTRIELTSDDDERRYATMGRDIIVGWNVVDADGEPVPVPDTKAVFDELLPDEMTGQIFSLWARAMEERVTIPKASDDGSGTTSTTSTSAPSGEMA
jgi:hypothetical protein